MHKTSKRRRLVRGGQWERETVNLAHPDATIPLHNHNVEKEGWPREGPGGEGKKTKNVKNKCRVIMGGALQRWRDPPRQLKGVKMDAEVAFFLLDRTIKLGSCYFPQSR